MIILLFEIILITVGLLSFLLFGKTKNKSEDEKCLIYEGDKCLSCKTGFKLVDGECIDNYSFKAVYFVDQENKTLNLIYETYSDEIIELIIDDNKINKSYTNYTFNSKGFYTVYFLLNLINMTSFNSMFRYISSITSIHFS